MSYTPNNWKPGDVLTAAKMNKLEAAVAQGGSGGGSFKVNVNVSSDTPTLDASYNDIVAAVEGGKIVFLQDTAANIEQLGYLITYGITNDNHFQVSFISLFNLSNVMVYNWQSDTADGQLIFTETGSSSGGGKL